MALNTVRPNSGPPRQNTPREVPPPAPEPTPVPAAAVVEEAAPAPAPRPERAPRPEKPRRQSSWSIFSLVERVVNVDALFRDGVPVQLLPHILFVMLLILLYIGNTHYAARMNRNIQRLKTETEDLRADYTTLSADYMEASKQSEVARKVAAYGLIESSSPPFSIKVPAGGLEEAKLDELPVLTADSIAAQAVRDSLAAAATAPAPLEALEPEPTETTPPTPAQH